MRAMIDSVSSDGTMQLTVGKGCDMDDLVSLVGLVASVTPLKRQPRVFTTNQRWRLEGSQYSLAQQNRKRYAPK